MWDGDFGTIKNPNNPKCQLPGWAKRALRKTRALYKKKAHRQTRRVAKLEIKAKEEK